MDYFIVRLSSLTALSCFHYLEKSSLDIQQNIYFCIPLKKKENHISLEQHQGLQVRLSDSYIESAAVRMCFCLHYPGYLDKNPVWLFFIGFWIVENK